MALFVCKGEGVYTYGFSNAVERYHCLELDGDPWKRVQAFKYGVETMCVIGCDGLEPKRAGLNTSTGVVKWH
jgi:hypothetical protein